MPTFEQLVDPDELRTALGVSHVADPDVLVTVGDAASELLLAYLDPLDGPYATNPAVREAALAIAVDLWQHRVAPGGVMQAADFTPGPYRLGRSLVGRVSGLVAPWLDVDAMVG